MTANYLYEGKYITATSGGKVDVGDPVLVGSVLGVAAETADASGVPFSVAVEGVFRLPSDGKVASQGAKAYWDAANEAVTSDDDDGASPTPTAYPCIGYFWEAVSSGADECIVKLNG